MQRELRPPLPHIPLLCTYNTTTHTTNTHPSNIHTPYQQAHTTHPTPYTQPTHAPYLHKMAMAGCSATIPTRFARCFQTSRIVMLGRYWTISVVHSIIARQNTKHFNNVQGSRYTLVCSTRGQLPFVNVPNTAHRSYFKKERVKHIRCHCHGTDTYCSLLTYFAIFGTAERCTCIRFLARLNGALASDFWHGWTVHLHQIFGTAERCTCIRFLARLNDALASDFWHGWTVHLHQIFWDRLVLSNLVP